MAHCYNASPQEAMAGWTAERGRKGNHVWILSTSQELSHLIVWVIILKTKRLGLWEFLRVT